MPGFDTFNYLIICMKAKYSNTGIWVTLFSLLPLLYFDTGDGLTHLHKHIRVGWFFRYRRWDIRVGWFFVSKFNKLHATKLWQTKKIPTSLKKEVAKLLFFGKITCLGSEQIFKINFASLAALFAVAQKVMQSPSSDINQRC